MIFFFLFLLLLDARSPAASDDNIVCRDANDPPETMDMSDVSNDSDSEGRPTNDQDGSEIPGTLSCLFLYMFIIFGYTCPDVV